MKLIDKLVIGGSAVAALTFLESARELRSLTVRNIKLNNDMTESKPVRLAFIADFHESLEGKVAHGGHHSHFLLAMPRGQH